MPLRALTTLAVFVFASNLWAQESPAAAAQREAMKKLAGWVGTWKGAGWVQRGPNNRHEFQVTETIQPKIGGLVLLVEGLGKTKADDGTETIGHNALALVSYDEKAKRYVFHNHTMQGRSGNDELKILGDGHYEWGFKEERAGIAIRFTIQMDGKTWTESGEMSRDGTNWVKFMEMKLTRQ